MCVLPEQLTDGVSPGSLLVRAPGWGWGEVPGQGLSRPTQSSVYLSASGVSMPPSQTGKRDGAQACWGLEALGSFVMQPGCP